MRVALAFSGGGHRACVFALGVLLYLADAGKSTQISSIASVSGGSLANGAIAQDLDLSTASAEDVESAVGRVARRVTGLGTLFGAALTWIYLLPLIVALAAAAVVPWLLPLGISWRILIFIAAALLVAWFAGLRGAVTARAFGSTLFKRQKKRTRLDEIHGTVDHIICATDLHAGEHVYFSKRFVYSYRFGRGKPGKTRLEKVVQASAAFPGAFPVTRIRTKHLAFTDGRPEAEGTRSLVLHDGGVYDNMGDQWATGLERRARRGGLGESFNGADELVVVSGSAGMDFGGLRRLRIPILGELLALLQDKSVLYDNGNSLRRQQLVASFDRAARQQQGLRGCLVHISQSPFLVPDYFAARKAEWPERAERASDAITLLLAGQPDDEASRAPWKDVADDNADVKTTLFGFKKQLTARLLNHAYVLAMVNLHVFLDYPLLDLPARERFDALLEC